MITLRGEGGAALTLADLAADVLLDRAFAWLCHQRRRWPDAADVWDFRRRWPEEKARLQAELRDGRFGFGLLCQRSRKTGPQVVA